jgi:hypothetical protein
MISESLSLTSNIPATRNAAVATRHREHVGGPGSALATISPMTPRLILLAGFLVSTLIAPRLVANDWDLMRPIVPHGYVCYHAERPIQIDGKLDDPAWQNAPWTEDFQDIEGSSKPKPTWRTHAKMLWDRDYFYVAAELEEPHVWGTVTQRDAVIFQDNDFEVFIDPDGDNHEYYEFEMNALNTVWDLFLRKPYKDGGPALNNWDIAGLKTGVHVNGTINDASDRDRSWTLEIAFPWKALREYAHRPAPPREGDQWRVNFSRVEWDIDIIGGKYQKVPNHPEHNWIWSPQGIIDMHRPERWAYVQFTSRQPGTVQFQPDAGVPAREALMTIYHAQHEFQKRTGKWAGTLAELGLNSSSFSGVAGEPTLKLTKDGFIATAGVNSARSQRQVWQVRQDSKLQRR